MSSPDYQDALRGLKAPEFLASPKFTEQQMRTDAIHAHPWIYEFKRCMVKRMAKLHIPFYATEVWRDAERQKMLYVKGNSLVTDSAHMHGMAVDLVHSLKLWDLTTEQWKIVGHIGIELAKSKGFKLVWGGDWDGDGDYTDQKLFDPAHWEVKNWRNLKGAEKWPMPLTAQQAELTRRRL